MAQFANMYDIDLLTRNDPQPLRATIGEGDANGLRVGANVTSGGSPVTLGGQCVGKVMRADGATVPLTGSVSGSSAWVVLDQESCKIEGPIQVAVMWVSGTNITTLVVAYGTVVRAETGNTVEPSTPIPDLTQLLAEIENMRDATADAEAAASKSVRYDTAQSLTTAQILQARANIDAASGTELAAEVSARQAADNEFENALGMATEDIEYMAITAGMGGEKNGLTVTRVDDHTIRLYGTASANRRFCYYNGQDSLKATTNAFDQTIPAGTYIFESVVSGTKTTHNIEYTYSTFSAREGYLRTNQDPERVAKIITLTAPTMIGLSLTQNSNYGTSDAPTEVMLRAYRITGKDIIARNDAESLASALVLSMSGARVTVIPDETDYDDLIQAGSYVCTSAAHAATMIHAPTSQGHRLYVMQGVNSSRIIQIVVSSYTSSAINKRYGYTEEVEGVTVWRWTDWQQLATTQEVDDGLSRAMIMSTGGGRTTTIADGTNYDNLTPVGSYVCTSAAHAKTMLNCPTGQGHRLYVLDGVNNLRKIQIIIVSFRDVAIYRRYGTYNSTDSTWAWPEEWITSADVNGMDGSRVMLSRDDIQYAESAGKTNMPYVPLADVRTYAYNEGYPTRKSALAEGAESTGILYESDHYFSRDALFNFSLESYYSMMNCSESLLYTFEDDHTPQRSYTGAVCSSIVSWLTGLPIYYTTYDILKMLDYKNISNLSEVEVGDVLIANSQFEDRVDHGMVVTGVLVGKSGVSAIEVTEGRAPRSRTIVYSAEEFWGLFDGTTSVGNHYQIGHIPNSHPRVIPRLTINTDIITERGDNAYFERGEDIFVQSSQNSFYADSPDEETVVTVNYSSMPQKSEGSILRNIKSALYGANTPDSQVLGRWTLHGANDELSHITIIKKGTATLSYSNNTLTVTLSGYAACMPCGFAVVRVRTGGTWAYDPHMDGDYSAMRLTIYKMDDPRYAGALEPEEGEPTFSFDVDMSAFRKEVEYDYGAYVRVFYETGCGQAWQDALADGRPIAW